VSGALLHSQLDDLNARQLSVIRATQYNSCHARNAHAHRPKGSEKGVSNPEIEGGWRQGGEKKKAESGNQ
jgi:hypothetical protein